LSRQYPFVRNLILVLVMVALLQVGGGSPQQACAAKPIALRPPFDGTRRLTAYFDHHYPNYGDDGQVTIYTGEGVVDCSPHCYSGHSGTDWALETGTPILAAADGVVRGRAQLSTGYGWRLVLEHAGGYYTLYAHLSGFNVVLGQPVKAGDVIGWSGNTGNSTGPHLHFGVYRGPCVNPDGTVYDYHATDPLGWRGLDADPMESNPPPLSQHTAVCLWRSHSGDLVSCRDTIVESAGAGASAYPSAAWQSGNGGNGYHTHYRSNTATQADYYHWTTAALPNPLRPGLADVYVFVPWDPNGSALPSLSQQVSYDVWTVDGWQRVTIDQSANVNQWVLLGSFVIPDHGEVIAWAYTGEEAGTRWVMADAVKWRQSLTHLPVTLSNHCTPHYGELIVNGGFDAGDSMGWTTSRSGGADPIVQPYGAGQHAAWMGRYDLNQDTLAQTICLAEDASSITLTFWWWVSTSDMSETDTDFLHVYLRDVDGGLLVPAPFSTLTNRASQGQWNSTDVDLTPYAGQTVVVSFEASNDAEGPTSFWLDDVSVTVSR
jgi:hypothetical protein